MATLAEQRAGARTPASTTPGQLSGARRPPAPAPMGPPAIGDELAALRKRLNLGRPQSNDPNDPYIFTKRTIGIGGNNKTTWGSWRAAAGGGAKRMTQLQDEFYKIPREQLKALQARLKRGGFYQAPFAEGVHDEATFEAYSIALDRTASFNIAGNNLSLDEVIDTSEAPPEDSQEIEAFKAKVSNTDDLRGMVGKVASLVAGQRLPDHVVNNLVTEFQNLEISEQRSAYDLALNNTEGVTVAAPDAQNFLTQKVREADPTAARAHDLTEQGKVFMSMLGGIGEYA